MKTLIRSLFPSFLFLVVFLLLQESLVRIGFLSAQLFPPFSSLVSAAQEYSQDLRMAFKESLFASLGGFFLSLILGTTLAFLFSFFKILKKALLPFAIFFQTVPIIAIAPLLVIYFGFGIETVLASSVIVSVFPILANTLIGLESIPPAFYELFSLSRATRWQMLTKLQIPAAYSSLYTGAKISCGLAVIGTVAGEFVAGGGIGALIDSARTQQRIDLVFLGLIALSVIGLILVGILKLIHNGIQKYRPYGLHLKD